MNQKKCSNAAWATFRVAIPEGYCLSCRGCCRFPSSQSHWRPYLTSKETLDWRRYGFERNAWLDWEGRIKTNEDSGHRQAVCRCLDPETHHCGVYEQAPWECRWYPFVVACDEKGEFWWGLHLGCPFVQDRSGDGFLNQYADEAKAFFSHHRTVALIQRYPNLAMPKATIDAECLWLGKLVVQDEAREVCVFNDIPDLPRRRLSVDAPVAVRLWSGVFDFSVAQRHGCACVFACDRLGVYLFFPPYGSGDAPAALDEAWRWMRAANGLTGITRVDHVTTQELALFSRGWRLQEAGCEYLYWRKDIARLSGHAFKFARHSRNRLVLNHEIHLRSITPHDEPACAAVFERWAAHRLAKTKDPIEAALIEETRVWHRLLRQTRDPDCRRWVVIVDGKVAGYAAGYALNDAVFVEAAEITDPDFPGLGSWVFHRLAQDPFVRQFDFINAMDDGGCPRLKVVKQRWQPVLTVPWWTAVLQEERDQ